MAVKAYRSNSLSVDEQARLFEVTDTLEDLVLFRLALTTGIRREDLTSIELGGIDLDSRRLTFWESKKKRFWTVPLASSVMPDLRRYLNSLPSGTKQLFGFSGRTAYNRLQKFLGKAGISKQVAFHDLRRSMMKTAKKRGLSKQAVAQITGDSYRTIEQYYTWLDSEELKDEADKL